MSYPVREIIFFYKSSWVYLCFKKTFCEIVLGFFNRRKCWWWWWWEGVCDGFRSVLNDFLDVTILHHGQFKTRTCFQLFKGASLVVSKTETQ